MPNLQPVLAYLNSNNLTERDKGTRFEEAAILFLRHAPAYAATFKRVMKFGEWAAEQGRRETDTGIDLVGELEDGTFAAIQAKFYEVDRSVSKPDLDSFLATSLDPRFTRRFVIATTDKRNDNAEETLVHAGVTWIGPGTLDDALDWSDFLQKSTVSPPAAKTVRPHQREAIDAAKAGFEVNDRGQLIMACGTGKTFTSLRLAEELVGPKGKVLFLVPSLSLLSQTLSEWAADATVKPRAYAVCSDSAVGKRKVTEEDKLTETIIDLAYPATTNAAALAKDFMRQPDDDRMTVVYSTYHSIQVVADAQAQHGFPEFDLIVCDEAHRTTGAIFEDRDESAFVKVHDAGFIKAKKRVYMTATPRVYGSAAKSKAKDASVELCSMDDATKFGPRFYTLSFSRAIDLDLLCDYKVMVLTIDEKQVSETIQELVVGGDMAIRVEDAGKILGCWKALLKEGISEGLHGDTAPMKRAVAFCQVIGDDKKPHDNRVTSKRITRVFGKVAAAYEAERPNPDRPKIACEVKHVDGSMNAIEKSEKLRWLREEPATPTCRILSNVRCLTEGVDVPALDAVLFLSPRKSTNEVVQAVGRVMRKSEGKKRGYVVLPIVIQPGADAEAVLNNNAAFQTVWQVLNALRSHDDRFDAHINKLEMTGEDTSRLEILSVLDGLLQSNTIPTPKPKGDGGGEDERPTHGIGEGVPVARTTPPTQLSLELGFDQIKRALQAKIVERCGNRKHWEEWAGDIAKVAQRHITRISTILANPNFPTERAAFDAFAAELRDDLNPSISDSEIVEMLAQHLVTAPVFSALFEDYAFADRNPVSTAMQQVIESLEPHRLDVETGSLEAFYKSIRERVRNIQRAADRQKIVVELYDKFFSKAFPRLQEKLGIVYTPVEVVDFILHSVEHLLRQEFDTTMADENVHILDPFTGTGTFITRLIQSGIIPKDRLAQKYGKELHANELVLLAYYIASVNIESVYHDAVEATDYEPFGGICLTDTFQMYEGEDLISQLLADNSGRRGRQKELPVRVILGNPPYSAGQKNANDNNQNVKYPALDARIRETYGACTNATSSNKLYDSYIRAIRWASDRIGTQGIIGFVTNAGWVDSRNADGLRKCLAEEFSSLYVFHLRGNARTSGEQRRKESGNAFGEGSRSPIAISFLVKNPNANEDGRILFYDIGDYLTRQQKLEKVAKLGSIASFGAPDSEDACAIWQTIVPDAHGDWLKQRSDDFAQHIVMGDKKGDGITLFQNHSVGVITARDAWCLGSSENAVATNIERMVDAYNVERKRYANACEGMTKAERPSVEDIVTADPRILSWTHNLKEDVTRNRALTFDKAKVVRCLYRPFTRQHLYFDRRLNERVSQMPRIFPVPAVDNLLIQVTGTGKRDFSALISDSPVEFQTLFNGQHFPLYLYDGDADTAADAAAAEQQSLLDTEPARKTERRDAITDAGLAHFAEAYPGETIAKEDLFYFTYGVLHAPSYREQYADNLSKELPRIPRVKAFEDFCTFRDAGRALAALHLGFDSEAVPLWPATIDTKSAALSDADYRVEKMRYASKDDKTTVIYNDKITVRGLPLEAQGYVVNGKPALDWVIERQGVRIDKDSGIVNDANDFATETMGNPRYPLELLLRVATVSVETMKIVNGLPEVVW